MPYKYNMIQCIMKPKVSVAFCCLVSRHKSSVIKTVAKILNMFLTIFGCVCSQVLESSVRHLACKIWIEWFLA